MIGGCNDPWFEQAFELYSEAIGKKAKLAHSGEALQWMIKQHTNTELQGLRPQEVSAIGTRTAMTLGTDIRGDINQREFEVCI